MNNCDVCGKKETLPYKCKYCGGTFCSEHRLPEAHDCTFDGDYWNVPVNVGKSEDSKSKGKNVKIPIFGGSSNSSSSSGSHGRRGSSVNFADYGIPKPARGITAYGYNNIILATCTVFFFISMIYSPIVGFLALYPLNVFIMPWQMVTSIFLHSGFSHFLVNMIVLLFFGTELERRVGGKNYLYIFFLSGIAGNLAYLAFAYSTGSGIPALGASGAIYGVMGTLAIIAPEIRVLFFFFLPMNIRVAILIFAAWDVLMLPYSFETGVAHAAHLAGLLVGLYYGKKLRIVRNWRIF